MGYIILGSSTKLEKGEDNEEYKENDLHTRMEIHMHVNDGISKTLRKSETA